MVSTNKQRHPQEVEAVVEFSDHVEELAKYCRLPSDADADMIAAPPLAGFVSALAESLHVAGQGATGLPREAMRT